MKKRNDKKKHKSHTKKKKWSHSILFLTGIALTIYFLFILSIQGITKPFPFHHEIAIILVTILTLSFLIERGITFNVNKVFESFYSSYLAFMLLMLSTIYWLVYIYNLNAGAFNTLIVLTFIITFLYSIISLKHSDKLWFIVISYVFIVLITIIVFAFIYWTLSIFNLGHLQFSQCDAIKPSAFSENYIYFSSVTFYSLGYGDICPIKPLARFFSQIQVGLGALLNTILIGFIFLKLREITPRNRKDKNL